MNLIKEVKERVDIVKVAEYYGLKLNRAYKCICPFHKERSASFSISPQKQIFHCFGCDAGGDVITLVAKLLNVNSLEAAKSINYTLGLGLDSKQKSTYLEINRYKEKRKLEETFKKWKLETFILLTDYLHLLRDWKNLRDFENELFVEALQQIDYIEYIVETVFINGTDEDKVKFWKNEKRMVKRVETRIRPFRATNR